MNVLLLMIGTSLLIHSYSIGESTCSPYKLSSVKSKIFKTINSIAVKPTATPEKGTAWICLSIAVTLIYNNEHTTLDVINPRPSV